MGYRLIHSNYANWTVERIQGRKYRYSYYLIEPNVCKWNFARKRVSGSIAILKI
jgi:hypothetical protein